MSIAWSGWQSLGSPAGTPIGRPFVQTNQDGRLEVFAVGQGRIFNIWQIAPNGAWADHWGQLDRPTPDIGVQVHTVGVNADGRQEIFAVGDDGGIWHKWQTGPNGGWSQWAALARPGDKGIIAFADRIHLGKNQDGRQELFAVGSDNNVWEIWQTAPNGGWSDWRQLGSPPPGIRAVDRMTVGFNEDGRQELFLIGKDDALWHIWQVAPNGGWGDWQSLGKPRDPFDSSEGPKDRDLTNPIVKSNTDGHLEVFCPGNGAFCNRWQEQWRDLAKITWRHQGWNQKPKPSPSVGLIWLDAARNFQGRLEAHGFADDGALWHAWQVDVTPFWSAWESLKTPPANLRFADRFTIGTNQDGRLEVFAMGADGRLWHIWQVK